VRLAQLFADLAFKRRQCRRAIEPAVNAGCRAHSCGKREHGVSNLGVPRCCGTDQYCTLIAIKRYVSVVCILIIPIAKFVAGMLAVDALDADLVDRIALDPQSVAAENRRVELVDTAIQNAGYAVEPQFRFSKSSLRRVQLG